MSEFAEFWQNIRPTFLSFAWVAAVAGGILLLLSYWKARVLRAGFEPGLLPPQRHRDVPWLFRDVALLIILGIGSEVVLLPAFRAAGRAAAPQPPVNWRELSARQTAEWLGFAVPATLGTSLTTTVSVPAALTASVHVKEQRRVEQRWLMIGLAVCRLFFFALAIFYLRWATGAWPEHLLLTTHQWLPNLWRGYVAFLLLTLPLFLLFLALVLLQNFVGKQTEHLVEQFLAQSPTLGDYLMVVFLSTVLAPLVEELLLRGIIQPLFIEDPLLADIVIIFSLCMAVMYGLSEQVNPSWAWGPLVFLILVGPGYLLFELLTRRLLPRPGAARGIFAASLLFALLHYTVWPSPVPIFFLGLALGWLAYRTQSLVPGIFCHALFNLVSLVSPFVGRG